MAGQSLLGVNPAVIRARIITVRVDDPQTRAQISRRASAAKWASRLRLGFVDPAGTYVGAEWVRTDGAQRVFETRVPADRQFELVLDSDLAIEDSSARRLPSRLLGGIKVAESASGQTATIRLNVK